MPTGTVTFLYTDIEGSTAGWERDPAAMKAAVAHQEALLRAAIDAHHGHVFRTVGDGLCAAFARSPDAVAGALAAQQALHAESWDGVGPLRARMALHTAIADLHNSDYVGAGLNRLGRLLAVGHGGQILLSGGIHPLVRDALPAGAGLRDLGEHRLRDLAQPERIYQLLHPDLPADFPPLRSLDTYHHNLPLQVTSFVGRAREMGAVADLLGTTRLLTLTGTGGAGKTRLALQVAVEQIERHPDGVWLVELAALDDPDRVPQAVALALGVREAIGQPLLTTVLAYLTTRRLLLILDNCEHLLDACAQLVDAVIHAGAGVTVLATSREPLGIAGEVSWRVPSLPVPSRDRSISSGEAALAALRQHDAVQLFIDRAVAVQPDFALTSQNALAMAHLCARLDGIPLALELAAARVRGLAVEQIAARLDQRFRLLTGGSRTALPRQQTLAATVDWSYQLLADAERTLFHRLAVFTGRFTLEAAEAVCAGDDLPLDEVLDGLLRLVDKSLVLAEAGHDGRTWYRLLETLRQYGRERLVACGQAEATQARHATYYLALAEEAAHECFGPRLKEWLARLEAELGNLRMALRWAVETGAGEQGLRLCGQLFIFWHYRGYPADGRAWLAEVVALPAASACVAGRGWALVAAAWLAHQMGDLTTARTWSEEAVALHRAAGDRAGLSLALAVRGRAESADGEVEAARMTLEEAVTVARASDDARPLPFALYFLSNVVYYQGEYARSRALNEECLVISRAMGQQGMAASNLMWLGHLAVAQGDLAAARALYQESLTLRLELGIKYGIATTMAGFANLAAARGEPVRALRLAGAADRLCEEDGVPVFTIWTQAGIGRRVEGCRQVLGAASSDAAWAAGRALTLAEAVAEAGGGAIGRDG
jgi:predicted ATPase/class 3 adenylate cyclase